MTRELPPQQVLQELLNYEPNTGVLTWRLRTEAWFYECQRPADVMAGWNSRFAGKVALDCTDKRGAKSGNLLKRRVLAHRVIWKMQTGEDPETIDHINGDPSDNRWENLRSVGMLENQKNMRIRSDNVSGVTGVCWQSRESKWFAYLTANGKRIGVGWFHDFDEAVAARKSAEKKFGFHSNHGRAA